VVDKQASLYGSWPSPITSSLVAEGTTTGKREDLVVNEGRVYWSEKRSQEKGRSVLMCWSAEHSPFPVLPKRCYIRSKVHEYGGGAFAAFKKGVIFSCDEDQHLYMFSTHQELFPLTHVPYRRYANPCIHPNAGCLYVIEEDHSQHDVVTNRLIRIDLEGKDHPIVVHEGADFYSSPILHPCGTFLAFLSWDRPNMPWNESHLWLASLDRRGCAVKVQKVVGEKNESIGQPEWSTTGQLFFVSDRSGWWNLHLWHDGKVEKICPMQAECGVAHWVFGRSRYALMHFSPSRSSPSYSVALCYTLQGVDHIGILSIDLGKVEEISLPFTTYGDLRSMGDSLIFSAASPTQTWSLYRYHLPSSTLEEICDKKKEIISFDVLSLPQSIQFSTADSETAFGIYYPPRNHHWCGVPQEKAPLIVKSHGGPSTHVTSELKWETQFWTSRGFAVLYVNYRGSTGYGREYRERLKGGWGQVDVEDCIRGARHLIDQKMVDPQRIIIKGGSSGGYTALSALAFHSFFALGVSYYGISDLERLVDHTHKFESCYLEWLIGPYPEMRATYVARSPIHHLENISSPLLLFQGGKDPVVPVTQSERMATGLKRRHMPVAYLLFEEESHGFRLPETIQTALSSELFFYATLFHLPISEEMHPIVIDHLPHC